MRHYEEMFMKLGVSLAVIILRLTIQEIPSYDAFLINTLLVRHNACRYIIVIAATTLHIAGACMEYCLSTAYEECTSCTQM